MNFSSFILDFYCLPLRDILILMTVPTWVFLRLQERFEDKLLWKAFLLVCLAGTVAIILHQTVLHRERASIQLIYLIPLHSYREVLHGGNPEILRSNFMNVILFYPSGLLAASLLPRKWSGWFRVILPVLLLAGFSLGLEYYQYLCSIGRTEVDDVLHNSMGALLGCLCSLIPQLKK